MKKAIAIITLLFIFLIIYIYEMKFDHKICSPKKVKSLQSYNFKTGDVILFHASDNINSVLLGSYFVHVGIVYNPLHNDKPMFFEAAAVENMYLPIEGESPFEICNNKKGILVCDLVKRIERYSGYVFLKRLNKKVDPFLEIEFEKFIQFAMDNMYYDYRVFLTAISKYILGEKCNINTNCAELVFLSLICLGILPLCEYRKRILHYPRFIAKLSKCGNEYEYFSAIHIPVSLV
jgi:hypothetical protein